MCISQDEDRFRSSQESTAHSVSSQGTQVTNPPKEVWPFFLNFYSFRENAVFKLRWGGGGGIFFF